jgi:hypothetical protein
MPAIPGVIETYDKLKVLHKTKNDDYSGNHGPFYNFEVCEYISNLFTNTRDKVYAIFLSVKLARLSVVLTKSPNHETVEDTFDDLINYAAIWKADCMDRNKSTIRHITEKNTLRETRETLISEK